jgi:hypothetical protein
VRSLAVAVALLMCCAAVAAADAEQRAFQGRSLEEALRALQRSGLQIVFSSEVVTSDMRVAAEPRADTPLKQLDELLEPHGLKAERGPGQVIQIVRGRSETGRRSATKPPASSGAPGRRDPPPGAAGRSPREIAAFTDRILVSGAGTAAADRGVSEITFDASDLQAATSILHDDGLRAVQAMPQIAAGDDFRSELSVRGSPPRQIGVVIDDVSTPWLQHGVYGRGDAGSLSMFGSAILARATLQAGAYPRRYDDVLGAQVQLTLREGSRASTHFRGSAGGVSAAFIGEGPLGAEARGSWIVSVRNSYRSWPVKRLTENDVGFAFADAHAKVVYDVTATQRFDATVLGGRSAPDMADEPLVSPLGGGIDYAGMVTTGWRSALGSRTVVRQRLSLVGQELLSPAAPDQLAVRSRNGALGYRAEVFRASFGGLFEAGVEARRWSGVRGVELDGPAPVRDAFGATWWTRSTYASFARVVAPGVSVAGGLRASDSTFVRDTVLTPWLLGAWQFKTTWTFKASAGTSHQFPDLDAVRGTAAWADLEPERAALVDVGLEQRLSSGVRWQVMLHSRRESHVLHPPDGPWTADQNPLTEPPGLALQNSLRGSSRGVDLLVARDGAARLSGWMGYTYAVTRQTDTNTQEAFWGDFDRRHAFNAAGVFRIARETSAGMVLRGASGAPLPGYFTVRGGQLFAGNRRNEVRLPSYLRLDARLQRAFFSPRHRVTVFGEILNVLNRRNQGTAKGIIQPLTAEAIGFSRPLLDRRASIGIAFDVSR